MATPIKWGSEFLVNTTKVGFQSDSHATRLADGRFLVIWEDDSKSNQPAGGDTSVSAVRGQIFDAHGIKSGAEFILNTTTDDSPATAGHNPPFQRPLRRRLDGRQ